MSRSSNSIGNKFHGNSVYLYSGEEYEFKKIDKIIDLDTQVEFHGILGHKHARIKLSKEMVSNLEDLVMTHGYSLPELELKK